MSRGGPNLLNKDLFHCRLGKRTIEFRMSRDLNGVVVAPTSSLDATLQSLLEPLGDEALENWLETHAPNCLDHGSPGSFSEQCLHWWSNECPVFLAEP